MKVNCMTFCVLIKLLHDGTRTCAELAEETGLHKLTVYQYTREMHRQGLLHIAAWEPNSYGRSSIRIYMWGPGKDAKRKTVDRKVARQQRRERDRVAATINAFVGVTA
jgi:predicted ArsR family transcriptional regulator